MENLVGSPRLLRLFKWVQSSGRRQINHKQTCRASTGEDIGGWCGEGGLAEGWGWEQKLSKEQEQQGGM